MKKVILVTLQGDNIGNRLQNYALQEVIKSFGIDVYTPYYNLVEFEYFRSRVKFAVKVILGKMGIVKYRSDYIRKKRLNKYKIFNTQYIDNLFFVKYSNANKKIYDQIDFAITGSDQVWHGWSLNKDELRYFYLQHISYQKRIAYASSFGFDAFPEQDINIHREGILGINKLSCREKKGVELIKELTGRDAQLVLDPTLLLGKQEWEKLEKRPERIADDKYLLFYFLGNTNNYSAIIDKFANQKGLEIIDAYNPRSLVSQLTTPDEFIWLIRHAEYVCTDSFHATVFSIIFEKKFLVFRRDDLGMENMFNRIENVLDLFGVNERVFKGFINIIDNDYVLNDISYAKKNSLKFLMESLEINNE